MRYYLMMALAIVAGFSGQWWLAALALPVFLSTILGFRIYWEPKHKARIKQLHLGESGVKKAV